jgi:hypothetical protein
MREPEKFVVQSVSVVSSIPLSWLSRVVSSTGWVYQRIVQFLEDYLRNDSISVPPAARNLARSDCGSPGISLLELIASSGDGATRDDLYVLIALGLRMTFCGRVALTRRRA